MQLTLGLTGMDPATETALKAAFAEANNRLGRAWSLVSDSEAAHVVVDMDSMYGPMSWLRLHGAGKTVIGLTSAARVQTDHRLPRPFAVDDVVAMLQEIAPAVQEVAPAAVPAAAATQPSPAAPATIAADDVAPSMAPPGAAEESVNATEPVPTPAPPAYSAAAVAIPAEWSTPPVEAVPSAAVAAPAPAAAAASAPVPVATPVARRLIDRLASGALTGRTRIHHDGIGVLIDASQRTYHGPALLKPLASLLTAELADGDLKPVSATDWDREAASLGPAQPLSRLVWYRGLLAGQGPLAAGFDPGARYQLVKWPQTEREFPKHFRIATAMMKGPATLPEVADASGVGLDEVTDFVNANLATGFAEPYREPEPEPEPTKSGGLFGRLRGR
mgnify:FL=1